MITYLGADGNETQQDFTSQCVAIAQHSLILFFVSAASTVVSGIYSNLEAIHSSSGKLVGIFLVIDSYIFSMEAAHRVSCNDVWPRPIPYRLINQSTNKEIAKMNVRVPIHMVREV
jgi:hypothetical protein